MRAAPSQMQESRAHQSEPDWRRTAPVHDSGTVLNLAQQTLESDGHRCYRYEIVRDLVTALRRETFDLLVIEWSSQREGSLPLLQWVSAHLADRPPVLVLSPYGETIEIADTAPVGVKDGSVEPPSAPIGRVSALLCRRAREPENATGTLRLGPYLFERDRGVVSLKGQSIPLTPKEYDLALLFFKNSNRTLSRTYLMEQVWKSGINLSTRTLDMHISRIRAKMSLDLENGVRLRTVVGQGYQLQIHCLDQGSPKPIRLGGEPAGDGVQ